MAGSALSAAPAGAVGEGRYLLSVCNVGTLVRSLACEDMGEERRVSLTMGQIDVLTERARLMGLDGSDRGAVRRLVWREIGTDAVDHTVVEQIADQLRGRH
jgi:hypothetical protein